MKYVVLAAGSGIDSITSLNNIPKCLLDINGKTVIQNIEEICNSNNIEDINIVGGFEILKIIEKYPYHKFFYNERWKETNSLYSLHKAINIINDDIIVSYSDIVHNSDTIKNLIHNTNKIRVIYDSLWESGYEDRRADYLEKIFNTNGEMLGEFAGLFFIPKDQVPDVKVKIDQLLDSNLKSSILDLINLLLKLDAAEIVDIHGNWAELDSLQDIEHFKFGTKAETLKSLQGKLKLSFILDQYTFNIEDYKDNKNIIINNIQSKLSSKLLVVRSSALNEDTHNSSNAGSYESILKVIKDDHSNVKDSIEMVIGSYTKNNQLQNDKNQILIQPYLENVTMSGVVFTKNLQTNSPYYTINYSKGNNTESVTSGGKCDLNTFICYRKYEENIGNKYLKTLIEAVKEIESITSFDAIDIEFAFVDEQLYLLQVRPIAASKGTLKVLDIDINNEVNSLRNFLCLSSNPSLLGKRNAYGVMPDWNPAEIIGINPKSLAFDLYKYIITDNIWAKSRSQLGYRDVGQSAGLISFSGKPYVDIQMSFNTFIPASIDHKIAEKLVNYFIDKLEKHPEYHDKVEFGIAITAFDFEFDKKQKELVDYGFSHKEIVQISKSYKYLTQNIINETIMTIDDQLSNLITLQEKRKHVILSNMSVFDKIYSLLEDCKTYGTLPFSNLARFSFVGQVFLKSLLSQSIISIEDYDNFFKSIHTVAKSFIEDFNLFVTNKLSKDEFISNYGHLRPGTYDITSLTYKDNFDEYIDSNATFIKNKTISDFQFSSSVKDRISEEIKKYNLAFDVDTLITFIIKSTEARERAKFEFTKNLSLVLNLIEGFSNKLGLSTNDLAYLNLSYILKYKNSSSNIGLTDDFRKNINTNKTKHLLTSAIQLPELIFSKKDIDMFFYSALKPNFVTNLTLTNEIVILDNDHKIDIVDKIVLIEHADPGFDWIFSHNIKGLVTKYGGAASHMVIRCAELDLPAAIGCGDKIFNELLKFDKISLDCVNHKIKGIY